MSDSSLRRLAWAVFAVTTALLLAALVLEWLIRDLDERIELRCERCGLPVHDHDSR